MLPKPREQQMIRVFIDINTCDIRIKREDYLPMGKPTNKFYVSSMSGADTRSKFLHKEIEYYKTVYKDEGDVSDTEIINEIKPMLLDIHTDAKKYLQNVTYLLTKTMGVHQ